MGKVQKILDLVKEIRRTCVELMSEAPRSVWKNIMDIDDSLDIITYWAERLNEKYVDEVMGD